jgi:phospholipid/cholesterol/gamma-HCH transport system permease protein
MATATTRTLRGNVGHVGPRSWRKPAEPTLIVEGRNGNPALRGTLDIRTVAQAKRDLERAWGKGESRALDLRGLDQLDTPGALLLCALRGNAVELTGVRPEHQALLDLIGGLALQPLPKPRTVSRARQIVTQLGRASDEAWRDTIDVITFVGRAANAVVYMLVHPAAWRPASISRQIAETGVYALPIVGLLAVMISVVIAYQGVAQLRPYGGEGLTIDLVAVSVLREMGVLITAILVAGRSGSAFTAEIGVMRTREEVDALEVMGLDRMQLLVVPRIVGLVITLPLLTFYADVMGLAGGAVVSQLLLGVQPAQYLIQLRHAVDLGDFLVGLFKAPVFALVIGVVGCMHGLRVGGSAESVGRETTRSVVKAIFLVIVLDALFSILFERLGV